MLEFGEVVYSVFVFPVYSVVGLVPLELADFFIFLPVEEVSVL